MKQEEIEKQAEIYTKDKHCKGECGNIPYCRENNIEDCCRDCRKTNEDFIAGAKWGYEKGYEDCRHYAHDYYKPKWHDLRKNPDDLPNRTGEYWICYKSTNENKKYYIETPYYTETKCWGCLNEVIAWCELPQFKE